MNKLKISKNRLVLSTILTLLMIAIPIFVSAQSLDSDPALDPDTQFYVAKRNQDAIDQIAVLTSSGEKADAELIRQLVMMGRSDPNLPSPFKYMPLPRLLLITQPEMTGLPGTQDIP